MSNIARDAPSVKLDRNFLNYPVARDARTKDTKAHLPGEYKIKLIGKNTWPPTALDMAVLFALIFEIQKTKSAELSLKYSTLLRRCGLTLHDDNRKSVKKALRLWSRLTLKFERWHDPKKGKIVKVLPPPIAACERKGKVVVTINKDWVELALDKGGYFFAVPLPLPLKAVDQNAALMILTQPQRQVPVEGGYAVHTEVKQSAFAGKMGLSRKNRRKRLTASLARVANWFVAIGGDLDPLFAGSHFNGRFVVRTGMIGFFMKLPKDKKRQNQMGRERSPKWDVNVAFDTPKQDVHVGPTYDTERSSNEAAARPKRSLREIEVKKASKKVDSYSPPIPRRRRYNTRELEETMSVSNLKPLGGDETEPLSHADPYADLDDPRMRRRK